jgi:hypothetical protein
MSSFIRFLKYECSAIQACIESGVSLEEETTDFESKIIEHVSKNPRLQEYFDAKVSFEVTNMNICPNDLLISWSRALRLAILEHLMMFDIDVPWLMEVIDRYRFEAEIGELVEIKRALDILGAEKRLSEYEALLYMKLKEREENEKEWEKLCEDRLSVSFVDHVKKFANWSLASILGIVGSQRLIEYFLSIDNSNSRLENDQIFLGLCYIGHLSVAQWLYSLGNMNNHTFIDLTFQSTCSKGHLSVAQWLYSLGDVNIHTEKEYTFRLACSGGHLSLAQWLYSLGGVNIHAENDEAFRWTC